MLAEEGAVVTVTAGTVMVRGSKTVTETTVGAEAFELVVFGSTGSEPVVFGSAGVTVGAGA